MIYCGIDIAKRDHEVSVIDAEGKPPFESISIANVQEGCEKLFALFERLGEEKAKELRDAAAGPFGVGFAKNTFAFQIRQLIKQLMFLENQIEELDEQISHLLKQVNQVITTIAGIGDKMGSIIISEIGDIPHFDAPEQVDGLCWAVCESYAIRRVFQDKTIYLKARLTLSTAGYLACGQPCSVLRPNSIVTKDQR